MSWDSGDERQAVLVRLSMTTTWCRFLVSHAAWATHVGDNKLEVRARYGCSLSACEGGIRAAYLAATAAPDMTDAARLRMLTKAAVRVGLAVLDKFQQVEKERREMACPALAASRDRS